MSAEHKIIWDRKSKRILAICETQETAHSTAESISYLRNRNAIYGLFDIELTNQKHLCLTKEGRCAWNNFFGEL